MEIITLIGKGDSGKSTVLKKLIAELSGKEGKNLIDVPAASRCKIFISPKKKEKLKKETGDALVKVKYKSYTIGILSAGDNEKEIKPRFELLKDCDLFICPSRPGGSSFRYINELEKKYNVTRLYAIHLSGNEEDWKYNVLIEERNKLSLNEIKECIKNKLEAFKK